MLDMSSSSATERDEATTNTQIQYITFFWIWFNNQMPNAANNFFSYHYLCTLIVTLLFKARWKGLIRYGQLSEVLKHTDGCLDKMVRDHDGTPPKWGWHCSRISDTFGEINFRAEQNLCSDSGPWTRMKCARNISRNRWLLLVVGTHNNICYVLI